MRFYAGRISLLPIKQNIFYKKGNEENFSLVLELMSKNIRYNIKKNVFVMEPILDEKKCLLGGKIGRQTVVNLPLHKEGALNKYPTKVYPFVIFIVKEKEQIILVERNTQAFSNPSSVFKYIQYYLNQKLASKGLEVLIRPLTSRGVFWRIVEKMDEIYQVEFSLAVPNFIGDSYRELKEILEDQKKRFNANIARYGIANENGELKLKNGGYLDPAINWVEDGCGEWSIKGKSNDAKKRRTYKNDEQLMYIDSEMEIDIKKIEDIKNLKRSLKIKPRTIGNQD